MRVATGLKEQAPGPDPAPVGKAWAALAAGERLDVFAEHTSSEAKTAAGRWRALGELAFAEFLRLETAFAHRLDPFMMGLENLLWKARL